MMVIDFNQDGAVQSMHREGVLELGFLGAQHIVRATDIRFDADTQSWGIWPSDGNDGFTPPPCQEASGFRSYETARDVEVQWLEQARMVGVDPCSSAGLACLRGVLGLAR